MRDPFSESDVFGESEFPHVRCEVSDHLLGGRIGWVVCREREVRITHAAGRSVGIEGAVAAANTTFDIPDTANVLTGLEAFIGDAEFTEGLRCGEAARARSYDRDLLAIHVY